MMEDNRKDYFKKMSSEELKKYFADQGINNLFLEGVLTNPLGLHNGIYNYEIKPFEPSTPPGKSLLYILKVEDHAGRIYETVLKHYPELEIASSLSGVPRFRAPTAYEAPIGLVLTEQGGLVPNTYFSKILGNGKEQLICMQKFYTDARALFNSLAKDYHKLVHQADELHKKELMGKVGFVIELLTDALIINCSLINDHRSQINALVTADLGLSEPPDVSFTHQKYLINLNDYVNRIIEFAKSHWLQMFPDLNLDERLLDKNTKERMDRSIQQKIGFPFDSGIELIASIISQVPSKKEFDYWPLDVQPSHNLLTWDIYNGLETLLWNPEIKLEEYKKKIGYDPEHKAILEFKNPPVMRDKNKTRMYSGIAQIDMDQVVTNVPAALIWAGFLPTIWDILDEKKRHELTEHFIAETRRMNGDVDIDLQKAATAELYKYITQFGSQYRQSLRYMFIKSLAYQIAIGEIKNDAEGEGWQNYKNVIQRILGLPKGEYELEHPINNQLAMLLNKDVFEDILRKL